MSDGVAQASRAANEEPVAQPSRAAKPAGMRRVKIAGLSTYVPPKLLTNQDLEKLVETTDEWILQRTGIKQRHIVEPGTATSDLAREAALGAMKQAGITADQIGFIVVGTTTPDTIFPSTACVLQNKIGAHDKPVYNNRDVVILALVELGRIRELDHGAIHDRADEALLASTLEQLAEFPFATSDQRRKDLDARPGRPRENRIRDLPGALALNGLTTVRAMRRPSARVQQAEIVVYLSDRAHGGAVVLRGGSSVQNGTAHAPD